MQKAFLSHSSKQKPYVEVVAKRSGKDKIIYDAWCFEEGKEIVKEIEEQLEDTDLFVLFISKESLESSWVQSEVEQAEKLYK